MQTNVEFIKDLSTDQLIIEISHLSTPQVILWYISPMGLKNTAVEFYKNFIIQPILKKNPTTSFWLVDLSAWMAFKDPKSSISSVSSCCKAIENFSENIKCIRSAKIFKKMQEIHDKDLLDYFKKALQREFISQISKSFPNKNFTIKEIFLDNCPIMSHWNDYDVAKAYSVFQYLEGCLLVNEIFLYKHLMQKSSNEIQIVFALPNDEYNYYYDPSGSFQADVELLISHQCKVLKIEYPKLQIKFCSFNYGTKIQDRPYNAPGEFINVKDLSYETVAGNEEKDRVIKRSEYATTL